jgi:hypothetical protein
MQTSTHDLTIIHSWNDVPAFATEADEAAFWDTHTLADEMWQDASATDLPVAEQDYPVSLSLDADIARRARSVARHKGKSYISLLREFVVERLYEEERREGIIPGDEH